MVGWTETYAQEKSSIFAAVVTASGIVNERIMLANNTLISTSYMPSIKDYVPDFYVKGLSDGNALVAWGEEFRSTSRSQLKVEIIGKDGALTGKGVLLPLTYATPGFYIEPLPLGGFFTTECHPVIKSNGVSFVERNGTFFSNDATQIGESFIVDDYITDPNIRLLNMVGLSDGVAMLYSWVNNTLLPNAPYSMQLNKISLAGEKIYSDIPMTYDYTILPRNEVMVRLSNDDFIVAYYTASGNPVFNPATYGMLGQKFSTSLVEYPQIINYGSYEIPSLSINWEVATINDGSFAWVFYNKSANMNVVKAYDENSVNYASISPDNTFSNSRITGLASNGEQTIAVWNADVDTTQGPIVLVQLFDGNFNCIGGTQPPSATGSSATPVYTPTYSNSANSLFDNSMVGIALNTLQSMVEYCYE